MCDVCIRHKEIVVTDPRNTSATFGAPMDRDKFAEDVSLTNYQTTLFPMKLKVLRDKTDGSTRKHLRVVADLSYAVDYGRSPYVTALSQFDVLANDRVRFNDTTNANLGVRRHNSCRINLDINLFYTK